MKGIRLGSSKTPHTRLISKGIHSNTKINVTGEKEFSGTGVVEVNCEQAVFSLSKAFLIFFLIVVLVVSFCVYVCEVWLYIIHFRI